MRSLITGNLGFLGTNLTLFFLKKGFEVVGVDNFSYCSNIEALRIMKIYRNFKFFKVDIKDKRLIPKLIEKCDVIVNLAAFTHVDNSIRMPELFVKNNIASFQKFLNFFKESDKRRDKILIHVSTDEVYGEILKGEAKENNNFNPRNVYSATKVAQECLINAYKETYKLKAVVLRPCNVFGYWQHHEKLIPKTIILALKNKKVPVYGDGTQVREWLFCEDFNRAIELIIEKRIEDGVYNVGSGARKKNIEVVKKILNILNKDFSLIDFVGDRPGHDRRYAVNSERIKSLGFETKFDFEDALKRTTAWYVENTRNKKLKNKNYV
ncbi:MAG: GDP-mannose 4,6-dehydratase [Candidatus Woesearchaeota archaeon]